MTKFVDELPPTVVLKKICFVVLTSNYLPIYSTYILLKLPSL